MDKDYSAEDLRFYFLLTHYRHSLWFSPEKLTQAKNLRRKFQQKLEELKNLGNLSPLSRYCDSLSSADCQVLQSLEHATDSIDEALCDDLNTPMVMKHLMGVVEEIGKFTSECGNTAHPLVLERIQKWFSVQMRDLIGNDLVENKSTSNSPEIISGFLDFRQKVRKWAIENKSSELLQFCDEARNQLLESNIFCQDAKI